MLRDVLLAMPQNARPLRRSGLNSDGTPYQICFSSSSRSIHERVIAEPALHIADACQRYEAARSAMFDVLIERNAAELVPLVSSALETFGPAEGEGYAEYPDGVLWLAASERAPGAAIYLDARRGGERAAWERVQDWLARALASDGDARNAVAALSGSVDLLCIAIEGSSHENARVKLYWRLRAISRLTELGIELFADRRFARFAEMTIEQRAPRLSGLVFSLGFAVSTGRVSDAKLDICACTHCVARPLDSWRQLTSNVTREFAVLPFDDRTLASGTPAFFGLGLTPGGDARVNLYLTPLAAA